MKILIVIGMFFWILGFIRVGRVINDGLLVNKTFVRPPFFIYLICGMPKANNIPHGIIAIPSLWLQLNGLLLIICGLITVFATQKIVVIGGLYILGIILIMICVLTLFKNNSYKIDQYPK